MATAMEPETPPAARPSLSELATKIDNEQSLRKHVLAIGTIFQWPPLATLWLLEHDCAKSNGCACGVSRGSEASVGMQPHV